MSNVIESPPETGADKSVEANQSFFSILREAFTGTERNLTEGSLRKAIVLLSIPMIAEMLGESLFAVVDIFFVAKLGAEAVAVVGLTEAMVVIVYALALGISIGASATVARRIGEGDSEGAAQTIVQILYLGLIVSIIISLQRRVQLRRRVPDRPDWSKQRRLNYHLCIVKCSPQSLPFVRRER